MKHIFTLLLAVVSYTAFGQVLPLGSPTGLTEVKGSFAADSSLRLPRVNTSTQTRWRLQDSIGLLSCDATTHQLMYMANGTWSVVGNGGSSAGVLVNHVYVDSNVSQMLSHTLADTGSVSVRVDSNFSRILYAKPSSQYANWVPLTSASVISFNARAGAVIPRSGDYVTDSVIEGINNLYSTPERIQTTIYSDTGTKIIATPWSVHDTALTLLRKSDTTTKVVTPTQLDDSLAKKLSHNQTITLSGDLTGSGDTTITTTLSNSGVTPGTYNLVTVDIKGRVTTGDSIEYLTTNETIRLSGEVSGYGETAIATHVDSLDHIVGSSSAPSISAGTGAGTSPTISLTNATDISGFINITTGTSSAGSAIVATITFSKPFTGSNLPKVLISPTNANAAALYGAANVYVIQTTLTYFILEVGSTHLTDATSYTWSYIVTQ